MNGIDADALRECLRRVIDPEVGVNIVDLGLVYALTVEATCVHVALTMTSPACPLGEVIIDDVGATLRKALPPTMEIDVQLVWSPPWDPSMMSDAARAHFG